MAILYRLADLLDAARRRSLRDQRARQRHAGERDAVGCLHGSVDALLRGLDRQARRRGGAGGGRRPRRGAPRAVRGDRRDRPVERPDDGHGAEGGARAGRGQHRGGEAAGAGALRCAALRRARARSRVAAGCAQRRRRWRIRRRRARASPRHRQGLVHGRVRDRAAGDGGGGGDAHAAHVRARRQERQHRVPRRRSRRGDVDGGHARRGTAQRPGLRVADAPLRARRRVRRGRGARRRAGGSGARRRSVRPDGAHGPGRERGRVRAHPRCDRPCGRRRRGHAAHRRSEARW